MFKDTQTALYIYDAHNMHVWSDWVLLISLGSQPEDVDFVTLFLFLSVCKNEYIPVIIENYCNDYCLFNSNS